MNIRRGLFRIWLVAAALWAVWVAIVSWPSIHTPYMPRLEYRYIKDENRFVPRDEGLTTSQQFDMLTLHPLEFPNNVYLYSPDNPTVGDSKPYLKVFYETYVQPHDTEFSQKRRANLRDALGLAILPIIVSFLAGLTMIWVVAGFRTTG